jgi:hypothetical protein
VRATVLSFRGVAFNLGYALAGILFAQLTAHLRTTHPGAGENTIFSMALPWLPAGFLGCGLVLWLALRLAGRRNRGQNIPVRGILPFCRCPAAGKQVALWPTTTEAEHKSQALCPTTVASR